MGFAYKKSTYHRYMRDYRKKECAFTNQKRLYMFNFERKGEDLELNVEHYPALIFL